MRVLSGYCSAELEVKKSRFLAEAFAVQSQAEARALLRAQKLKYTESTHVVHAFVCGLGGEVLGCSDDGEPSGTAGRPVLEVLKGKNCTNIMLTVTRWFGGTLLGTGGLVKAYGDSAKAVLAQCSFAEYAPKSAFSFAAPYALYEQAKRLLAKHGCEISGEEFGEEVSVSGLVEDSLRAELAEGLFELSLGAIRLAQP